MNELMEKKQVLGCEHCPHCRRGLLEEKSWSMGSDLFDRLCRLNGTTRREVLIKNRNGSVEMKRHIICYLMREVGQFSFPCIGSFLNRDHSTIMHSCGLVGRRIAASTEFAKTIHRMREEVTELIREVAA